MKKIGFMFGAGAEICYGFPTGGEFALNIFREDAKFGKDEFKKMRKSIEPEERYLRWLPIKYKDNKVTVFKKDAFEEIIKSTLEDNKDNINSPLNNIDTLAINIVQVMESEQIDINNDFLIINGILIENSKMVDSLSFIGEFKSGDSLFKSNYFSALLMAYKILKKKTLSQKEELGLIITSIFQLKLGILGEELAQRINDNVFKKKDDELDILDDLGDIFKINYENAGIAGFEYILQIKSSNENTPEAHILKFAQNLIIKIYSHLLNYKSLIDSHWRYLYYPKQDWAKFCKISIFLFSVRNYLLKIFSKIDLKRTGYYDDLSVAVNNKTIEITAVATSNYSSLIKNKLGKEDIIYLNGSASLWYDPYLNRLGKKDDLSQNHFLVPLIFTQSGTKPMTSIDISSLYTQYYKNLEKSDKICIVGFNFNPDDEHINCIFREIIERNGIPLVVITLKNEKNEEEAKQGIIEKLKLEKNTDKISVILVDDERKCNGANWIDCLLK